MAKRSLDETTTRGKESPLCLLLHAVDGVVPYLTPNLLKECFPPAKVSETLWIGIAVRDTCVHPVHMDGDDPRTSNPRGYTFSGSGVRVDTWVEPYTRMTVPTFDLICDAATVTQVANDSYATDNKVMLWTPNGRQNITPDLYYNSCRGLKSKFATSLFDMAPPVDRNNQTSLSIRRTRKRQISANKRTREWWEHFYSLSQKDNIDPQYLWVPVSLNDASTTTELTAEMTILKEQEKDTRAGVVLIGWTDASSQTRRAFMEALKVSVGKLSLAVLSTRSLLDVLECLSFGVTVVGSDLPRLWALQKRVFLVDIRSDSFLDANKQRRIDGCNCFEGEMNELDDDGCLSLHPRDDKYDVTQHPWFRDNRPLVDGCQCRTCQVHSRAYVYHLVCAKELLSEMLIFIHNLHHMLEMLQAVSCLSRSRENEQAKPKFLKGILDQLPAASMMEMAKHWNVASDAIDHPE